MNQTQRNLVSFRVGSQWYGVDVATILEILHMVMLSEAPTSNPDILGLIVLRNNVIPVIDLRLRFGIAEPQFRLDTPIIALRTEWGSLGIVVDDIDNIEHTHPANISASLGADFPVISGTVQLPNKLLMLLNISALTAGSLAAS